MLQQRDATQVAPRGLQTTAASKLLRLPADAQTAYTLEVSLNRSQSAGQRRHRGNVNKAALKVFLAQLQALRSKNSIPPANVVRKEPEDEREKGCGLRSQRWGQHEGHFNIPKWVGTIDSIFFGALLRFLCFGCG